METRKILNLADPEYRAVNAVSKSALDQFAKSPAHYKHVIIDGNRTQATPAMELGSAFDTYLLTPEVFAAEYAIAPEVRRGTKAWDEFEAANPGKRIIKAEELARIEAMARAVLDHPAAGALLRDGDSQVSYFWTDERTGLPMKGRADYVRHDGIMIDVKTTQDASPEGFSRSVAAFRYHVQSSVYLSAQTATGGPTTDQFCFIAVEKEPPYAVAVYTLDPESLAEGFRVMGRDLARLKASIEANHFPAYSERVESIRLPKYAFGMGDT